MSRFLQAMAKGRIASLAGARAIVPGRALQAPGLRRLAGGIWMVEGLVEARSAR